MELHLYPLPPPVYFLMAWTGISSFLPLLVVLNRPVQIWAEAACYPMGTAGSFPVKKPWRVVDQSPPSNAKVKNVCIYKPHPFMECTETTLLYLPLLYF